MARARFDSFYAAGHDRCARCSTACASIIPTTSCRGDSRHHPEHHCQQRDAQWALSPGTGSHYPSDDFPGADGAPTRLFIEKKLFQDQAGPELLRSRGAAEYRRCFRNPPTSTHVQDYRAPMASTSTWDDAISPPAQDRLSCCCCGGATGGVGRNHKSMEIWPLCCRHQGRQGAAVRHYLSEKPEENASELARVLRGPIAALRAGPVLRGAELIMLNASANGMVTLT